MCLNCGCSDYWDKRGKETNITMADLEKAAHGEGMSLEETVEEMQHALQKALKQAKK